MRCCLYNNLSGLDNESLRQDKLYLYFTQLGKCMYTGERIKFDSLFDNNLYDIDHIYPRSKVKDDSPLTPTRFLEKAGQKLLFATAENRLC